MHFSKQVMHLSRARKVGIRPPGKGNSKTHDARPVYLIITMKTIRTSRLSMKNSLFHASQQIGYESVLEALQSHRQAVSKSVSQSVRHQGRQSVSQSVDHSVSQSIIMHQGRQAISKSVSPSVSQAVVKLATQPVSQLSSQQSIRHTTRRARGQAGSHA